MAEPSRSVGPCLGKVTACRPAAMPPGAAQDPLGDGGVQPVAVPGLLSEVTFASAVQASR